jgi:hypothetical protein
MNANMMADGVISLDDRPALEAIKRANAGLDDHEKKAKTVLDRTGREWQVYGDGLVRVTDKSKNSLDRLLQSMQKQSELAGKTGVERLIAQRDQLIGKWGQEQRAVEAITKAYDKMIAAEQGGGGSRWQGFADGVKNFIQNPIQAAGSAVGGLLEKLGPMGTALAAGAAALGAFAVASFSAAKGLGEYGVQIRDVELRTGLTAKEVGQFSYAAKAAGADVSIFERMMRGLSQAMDENSTEGEKARGMLQKLHVSLYDATTGGIKPTSQALQEISAAIAALPTAFERDAAAMALFKRAGIEAIPVMVELNANLATAKEKGYGPSDEDVERFLRYQRGVTQVETAWAEIVRHLKEFIVPTFDKGPANVAPATDLVSRVRNWMLGADDTGKMPVKRTGFLGLGAPEYWDMSVGHQPAPAPPGLTDSQQATIEAALSSDTSKGVMAAAQKALEKTQKELANLQSLGAPWEKMQPLAERAEQQKGAIGSLEAQIKATKDLTEAQRKQQEQALKFKAENNRYRQEQAEIEMYKSVPIAETPEAARFEEYAYEQQRKQKINPALLGLPSESDLREQMEGFAAGERIDSINLQSRADTLNRNAGRAQEMVGLSGATGTDAIRETYQIRIDLAKQLAGIEAERISKEANAAKQMEDIARAQALVQKQVAEAQEEALMKQMELQKQQVDALKKDTEGLWHTLLTKPRDFGKQLGSTVHEAVIRPVAEGMSAVTANVLKPIIYGQDGAGGLAGVFRGAFGGGKTDPMKLATDMNTAVTSQNSMALAALTAIMAGAMGMAAPAVAAPAGIAGISPPAISAPAVSRLFGSPINAGGFGIGTAPEGGGSNPLAMVMGGGSGGGTGGGEGVWSEIPTLNRSTGGGSNPLAMILGGGRQGGEAGGGAGGGGGSPLAMILGAGRQGGGAAPDGDGGSGTGGIGGIGGILKNFKSFKLGGLTRSDPTYGTDEDGSDVQTGGGKITGVNGMAGAALMAGGMMAAQQGLLGSWRGTKKGVLSGALGGAAIGMSEAGPVGAGIGAGVGLMIGFGEMLAGVETPENEAKRLVKQLYSVNIESSMAKQIVSIAQSKYGGQVSIAVRDPDVRKMLELYAQGTGQKMPLSATTPRGGSLAEQNGNLFQQATYVNGVANTFQSNLPVLGMPSMGTYPTPGGPNTGAGMGPTYLSVNVDGNGLAPFMTGQYVTSGFVSDQLTAAQNSSQGRVQQAANLVLPGLSVGS